MNVTFLGRLVGWTSIAASAAGAEADREAVVEEAEVDEVVEVEVEVELRKEGTEGVAGWALGGM